MLIPNSPGRLVVDQFRRSGLGSADQSSGSRDESAARVGQFIDQGPTLPLGLDQLRPCERLEVLADQSPLAARALAKLIDRVCASRQGKEVEDSKADRMRKRLEQASEPIGGGWVKSVLPTGADGLGHRISSPFLTESPLQVARTTWTKVSPFIVKTWMCCLPL